ncbi:ABC transporter substrate-binding protein [Campylobacterota bacterium]
MRLLIILLLLPLYSYAQDKPLEKVSVQLKWFYQYQFAGIIVAKEKGFYEKAGLDVTIKERDPAFNNIEQVIKGESEYGVADSVILRYRAEGNPVKVIATIFQHNAMVLISKKESGIVSPYEMKDKKISYQEGLDDSIITSVLAFANLKDKDFIKRPMDFTHMDFISGEVDVSEAYISIEPYWLKEKYGIDVNIIDPKNYGIDFYGDLLFTTEDEIKHHPQRVEAFKNATLKGWAYALQHKEEAIDIILEKYNTRDLNRKQLMYEARITQNLIATNYIPLGESKKERFKVLADLYLTHGLSKRSLDKAVEEIVYDPLNKKSIFQEHLNLILGTSLALTILVLLLMLYNMRLSHLVRLRTEELEESKHKAESAAAAKANFLANMSHEIRTPMNAILGFVEQLQKGELDPSRKKMFHTIQDSGQTLVAIINDILDITKVESGKMELEVRSHYLRNFFQELRDFFKTACDDKGIRLNVRFEDNVPQCTMIDEIRLKQVFINLVSNAIKFTESGGSITIDVLYNNDTGYLEFFVVDTGIGIAAENLNKIFNVFEQEDSSTTRRFGGTGLGLAICKKLIILMDGNISVSSTVGEGSRFYLRLPYRVCDEHSVIESEQMPTIKTAFQKGKVLVVEDNKTNQMLISLILDEFELDYEIANDGQEAVDMFANDPDYSVILMDENMPVMNGIEATRHIRAIEEERELTPTPIIAVTANALSSDRDMFMDAGMDDYIAKPYTEQTIKETLLKHIGTE